MMMTKAEALKIQSEQVKLYAESYGDFVYAAVAAETTADALADGQHDVVTINRHIPRGASIEFIIERYGYKTQASDKYGD